MPLRTPRSRIVPDVPAPGRPPARQEQTSTELRNSPTDAVRAFDKGSPRALIGQDDLRLGLSSSTKQSESSTEVRSVSTNPARASIELPPQVKESLGALDYRLSKVLASGAIRLVRSTWLSVQPSSYRMQCRQDLEELERRGVSPSPLLSTQEAVALLRRGDRSIGVLSYGWLSAKDPDPAGARVTRLRRALELQVHIEAIFWE